MIIGHTYRDYDFSASDFFGLFFRYDHMALFDKIIDSGRIFISSGVKDAIIGETFWLYKGMFVSEMRRILGSNDMGFFHLQKNGKVYFELIPYNEEQLESFNRESGAYRKLGEKLRQNYFGIVG